MIEKKTAVTCDCCTKKVVQGNRSEIQIEGIIFLLCLSCKMEELLDRIAG